MKLQHSCKILILLVVIINLQGLYTEEKHPGDTSQCKFDIVNRDEVKRTFEELSKMDDAWLIFFKITLLSKTFIKETNFDERHINDLTRWIWVPKKHSYLLTYPVDLAVITFRMSKNVEKNISLSANASFSFDQTNLQNYSICIESIYNSILENVLDGNKNDWLFCHRYFERQNYKHVLYTLTGAWLGYDFSCFDSVHHTVPSARYIQKGTVNVVINICIILLCLYFPLLYLLLPDRYNIDQDEVRFYRKGEYPYSFARLILRLHDTRKQEITEINSVEEWYDKFDINHFKPEIHIFSCMYIVTLVMYVFEDQYIKQVIPDYNYRPDIFPSLLTDTNVYVRLGFLTISYFVPIPLFIIAMSYFSQSNSNFLSVKPFGLVKIKDVWKNVEQREEKYIGYTRFAKKFLHRISLFFSLDLWATTFTCPCTAAKLLPCICNNNMYSKLCNIAIGIPIFFANFLLYSLLLLVPNIYFLFDCFIVFPIKMVRLLCQKIPKERMVIILFWSVFYLVLFWVCMVCFIRPYFLFVIQFILRSMVYVIFVAGPLFANVSDTMYSFWVVIVSVVIYLVQYTTSFHTNYKKLLDFLLQINRDRQSNHDSSRCTNSEVHTEKINVHAFDRIAEKYLQLRHQLFYLFLKIILTSLILYITFDSINRQENNQFTTSLLPTILTVALPSLAEKLCSSSNIDEILKLHEDEIKSDFLEGLNNTIPKTILCNVPDSKFKKRIMLGLPVLYSGYVFICFIRNSVCLRSSTVNARPRPSTYTDCCIQGNENHEQYELDGSSESSPLTPSKLKMK